MLPGGPLTVMDGFNILVKEQKESNMKTETFIAGMLVGAAAAVALSKKFMGKCTCSEMAGADENPALKEAEQAVDTLRGSVDCLRKELNNRIESEQTYAAKCEELKDQVAKQGVEIDNLKNIIDATNAQTKKLEDELEQNKAGK
jgi:septal ring factor EnvC (AmiA/AmiB activator)